MKKILSLVLVSILSIALFTSCSAKKDNVLKVATNAEFEPFEYMDGTTMVGFDVDLINEVAKKLGKKVEFSNMKFESILVAVQSGSSDIGIAGMTINSTRLESVDFSSAYYKASQVVIVKKDDTTFTGTTKDAINEQLKNKKIGVCSGFTGADYVQGSQELEFPGIEGATTKIYDNISLAIQDLKNNAIECIVMDDTVAKRASGIDANKADVKVIDVSLTDEAYGISIKKGNTDLKQKIDKALEELTQDGTVAKLVEKWLEK